MQLQQSFDQLSDQWKSHCEQPKIQYSSFADDRIDCEAYRKIVALGEKALPLILEKFRGDDKEAFFPIFGWASAISEITGDMPEIPEEMRGRVREVRDLVVAWLDKKLQTN